MSSNKLQYIRSTTIPFASSMRRFISKYRECTVGITFVVWCACCAWMPVTTDMFLLFYLIYQTPNAWQEENRDASVPIGVSKPLRWNSTNREHAPGQWVVVYARLGQTFPRSILHLVQSSEKGIEGEIQSLFSYSESHSYFILWKLTLPSFKSTRK